MEYSSNSHMTMALRGGKVQQSAFERFGTRVQLGNYIADIVADNEENPSVHHCIVQRVGCRTSSIWGRKALLQPLWNLATVALKSWLDCLRRKPRRFMNSKRPIPGKV